MKHFFILFILMMAVSKVIAQSSIMVQSFVPVFDDHTASSTEGQHVNENGTLDALIKVHTDGKTEYVFDGGMYGLLPMKNHNGEIWVYVPVDQTQIIIHSKAPKAFQTFFFPEALVSGNTYRMELRMGSEKASVTLKVDDDAEIWLNGEFKSVHSWSGSIPYGIYRIESRKENHKPSVTTKTIDSAMNGKTITLLSPWPIYSSLSVESMPSGAQLLIDGKLMGETPRFFTDLLIGEHEIRLVLEGYVDVVRTITLIQNTPVEVIEQLNPVKEEATPVAVTSIPKKEQDIKPHGLVPNKPSKKVRPFFITANVGVVSFPLMNYGLTFGYLKQFGFYVSMMSNGSFKGFSVTEQCDLNGITDGDHKPFYTGVSVKDRLSVIAGGVVRVSDVIAFKAGVGYGVRNLCWETKDGSYVMNKEFSLHGVDAAAGIQAHFEGFVISLEAVTTQFKTIEGRLGLGVSF